MVSAHKMLTELYYNYGNYVNKEKMLPSFNDGLLPVQRRMLTTLHLVAKSSYVKTAKVLGDCMSRFHPHSEALGTAEWLVQNEFSDGDGEWGTNLGVEKISCAAARYTKIKSSNWIEEIAFKYINSSPWIMGELDEEEPEVLPTMIPLCFLPKYETVSIAFGLRTEIPTYDLKDLKKRLLYLIKQGKKVVISPKMVGCKVLSTDNELELFLKGELKVIKGTGIYEIDELNKRVYIKGWNPRQTFPTLLKKIDSYKGWNILGSVSYIDESNDEDHTCIRLEVCRGRNISEYFDKLKESVIECLKFENNYNIACVDRSGEIVQPSIDVMLLNTYIFYKEIVKIHLTDNIKQLNDKISELDIISKIRPHLSVVSIKNKPEDDLISELAKLSNISDIGLLKKIMDKFKIRKLLSISTDITSIKNEITILTNNLNNIDNFVVNQYKEL